MRLSAFSGILVLLFLGTGMGGCFHSLQMDRGGRSSFRGLEDRNPPDGIAPISEREALDQLRQRAETGGARPNQVSTVSVLDSLNERYSHGFADRSEELASMTAALLRDPSEEVRFRTAELLGKIGTPNQEDALIETSEKDPSAVVREMAAESLERLGLGNEVWGE